jgi:hypothetical protein
LEQDLQYPWWELGKRGICRDEKGEGTPAAEKRAEVRGPDHGGKLRQNWIRGHGIGNVANLRRLGLGGRAEESEQQRGKQAARKGEPWEKTGFHREAKIEKAFIRYKLRDSSTW